MEITTRIVGLQQMLALERTVGARTEGLLTTSLMAIGGDIARDVQQRYQPYSSKGAIGIQPKALVSGLWVVQTIRKSRNPMRQRRTFGPLMMRRAFLPAVRDNESKILVAATAAVEQAWKEAA